MKVGIVMATTDLKEAIMNRKSVRKYEKKMLTLDDQAFIVNKINALNKNDMGIKMSLVFQSDEDVFTGILGSYGKITNAPAYIVLIGNKLAPHIESHIGYNGEQLVLECLSQGMSSCWVAGTFSSSKVSKQVTLEKNEKIYAIIAIGYEAKGEVDTMKKLSKGTKKPLDELWYKVPSTIPSVFKEPLALARLAPSAMNMQPWRFEVNENELSIHFSSGLLPKKAAIYSKALDCGIALCHLVIGLELSGVPFSIDFKDDCFVTIRLA